MRKFLFFLILLPAIVTLGHDAYIFTQNQDKGFRLTDIGALWEKYHAESHDQWKIKLTEFGNTVDDLTAIVTPPQATLTKTIEAQSATDYSGSFKQTDKEDEDSVVTTLQEESFVQTNTNSIQKTVGFFLEQTAVFVFSGFALIVFLLNFLISQMIKEKSGMNKLKSLKKKRKGGGYKHVRK